MGTPGASWLVTVIELAGVTATFLLTEVEISPEAEIPPRSSQPPGGSPGVLFPAEPEGAGAVVCKLQRILSSGLGLLQKTVHVLVCIAYSVLVSQKHPFRYFSKLNQTLELQQPGWRKIPNQS